MDQTAALDELATSIAAAWQQLKLDDIAAELQTLTTNMEQPDFWSDPERATAESKRQASLAKRLAPWTEIRAGVADLRELAAVNDPSLQPEIEAGAKELKDRFEQLKNELKFNGPYDDHDVIMSIYAGAGGTDAQDWAQMLLRMYVRWAEQNGFAVRMLDESAGDEAGIKSLR